MNTINEFKFNNAILKSVRDYGNVVKGIVQSRQVEFTPDGQMRARFIASRQVTFIDPDLVAELQTAIAEKGEFFVNLSGYMTTTVREDKGQTKWYDNQIVTNLEILK